MRIYFTALGFITRANGPAVRHDTSEKAFALPAPTPSRNGLICPIQVSLIAYSRVEPSAVLLYLCTCGR